MEENPEKAENLEPTEEVPAHDYLLYGISVFGAVRWKLGIYPHKSMAEDKAWVVGRMRPDLFFAISAETRDENNPVCYGSLDFE